MEEAIKLMSYPSTNEVLRVAERFLYEITLYKDYKDRSELVDSRFYSASRPVRYKSPVIMKMGDYILVKCVTLLEAPEDYLSLNGYVEYNADNKRRRTKKETK